jgi:hypothetical protein
MCTTRLASITLFAFFCSAAALSQSAAPQNTVNNDSVSRSRSRNSSLMARSEMQRPKPIPTVNTLRFQEIPAAAPQSNAPTNPVQFQDEVKKPATSMPVDGLENTQTLDVR